MRVTLLTLVTLLFSLSATANEKQLKLKMEKLKELQLKVKQECLDRGNPKDYKVYIEGKAYGCPELIVVADLLKKELDADVEKFKLDCEASNNKTPHSQLAGQTASIIQKSASCAQANDFKQCAAKFSCGVLSVAALNISGLPILGSNPKLMECASYAKGVPSCLLNVMRGIFDSIWSNLKLVWDLGKAAGEWLGIIKESEAKTSERAMLAQQASPGFIKRLRSDFSGTIKQLADDLYDSLKEAARNHYGCEKWSGTPYVSACLQPMSTWDCGTCQQKTQVFCGIAGYATGEIVTALITGGLVEGGKYTLSAAVRLGAVPTRAIGSFMSKQFPKASSVVVDAALSVKNLAKVSLTASQKALISLWRGISESKTAQAISSAASTVSNSIVGKIAGIGLKPAVIYLNAMGNAYEVGAKAVNTLAQRGSKAILRQEAIKGAEIANETLGVTGDATKLVDEAAEVAEDANKATTGIVVETSSSVTEGVKAPLTTEQKVAASTSDEMKPVDTQQSKPAAGQTVADQDVSELMKKYRTDPVYASLYKGPEMYQDHHKQLSLVIQAMEDASPQMTKIEIRKTIEQELRSCQL